MGEVELVVPILCGEENAGLAADDVSPPVQLGVLVGAMMENMSQCKYMIGWTDLFGVRRKDRAGWK
jgi:hypothetical protein